MTQNEEEELKAIEQEIIDSFEKKARTPEWANQPLRTQPLLMSYQDWEDIKKWASEP